MTDVKAHHVLWFMGTFITLWALSLIARGLRPRHGPPSTALALAGAVAFSLGIATLAAGTGLRVWVYGATAAAPEWSFLDASGAGLLAFALTLAAWALFSDRAAGRLRCPRCWYDLSGAESLAPCPECGHRPAHERDLSRTRPRRGLLALAAALALTGLILPRALNVRRGGVKAALPTTVMVMLVNTLPEPWLANGNVDDAWTLSARLAEGRAWEWQRRWCLRLVQRDLDEASTVSRLARARRATDLLDLHLDLPVSSDRICLAVLALASPNPPDRRDALELLARLEHAWLSTGNPHAAHQFRDAHATVASRIDELLPALRDEDPEVALTAAQWATGPRPDAAVDAILARCGPELDPRLLTTAVETLAPHAARRRDVADAIITLTRAPDGRTARRVWDALAHADADLPAPLLERADEALRRGEPAALPAAKIRLVGRHASPALLAELSSAAAEPSPRRAAALSALYTAHPDDEPLDGSRRILALALTDPDPGVRNLACRWIADLAAGHDMEACRPGLEALAKGDDRRNADFAAHALRCLNEARRPSP